MLKKNKDYIEMRVSSTDCAFTENEPTSICIDGYVYTSYMDLPNPGELYILISKEKFEKLRADTNINAELAKQWETNYNLLRDDISANSTVIESYECNIKKWQKATGCLRPEDISAASLITKAQQLDREVEIYTKALQEWKEVTGYPSPSAVKTALESGASWCHAYNEVKEANEKLADVIQKWKDMTKCETPEAAATWITHYESACGRGNRLAESVEKLKEEVVSWKNATGYSTPEDYMHARINCATPFDLTAVWQDATGCVTPDQVKSRIEGLENAVRLTNRNMIKEIESNIDEWQKFTGCDSPQKAGCKINSLCDEICKLKGDYDHLLELTGYKNEKGICAALVFSDENHLYITMRDLINSLKRKVKFTESNWQTATGCDTPGAAEKMLEYYKSRLGNAVQAASCAAKHLDNITF